MQPINRVLLESARDGSRDAFVSIIRAHSRMAFLTALSIVGSTEDAEDVVQDAFVRCWPRLGQCREPKAFAGWLRTIVRSVALNHIERETVRATQPLESVDLHSATTPERNLDRTLLRERLTVAMRCLTDVQREVLLFHDLEGFRHAEIGALIGISELMSRKHLSNARKRMRQALEEPESLRATK